MRCGRVIRVMQIDSLESIILDRAKRTLGVLRPAMRQLEETWA